MKARIYTKTGDKGETSLIGGSRVSKTESRLVAYGTLDELNSVLGIVRSHLNGSSSAASEFESHLRNVQNNLFNMGSHLACEDEELAAKLPGLSADGLTLLESDMDRWEAELPPLREFILPGGSPLAAFSHLARTVCRRAERDVLLLRNTGVVVAADHLIYLNRLSDWLFLLARKFNAVAGVADVTWSKG